MKDFIIIVLTIAGLMLLTVVIFTLLWGDKL